MNATFKESLRNSVTKKFCDRRKCYSSNLLEVVFDFFQILKLDFLFSKSGGCEQHLKSHGEYCDFVSSSHLRWGDV